MFQKLLKHNEKNLNAEIKAEIEALRRVLGAHGLSYEAPYDIKNLSEIRTWYISRLKYVPDMIDYENNEAKKKHEDVFKLKAEIRDKEHEIETLKTLLGWSKEDEQEWKDHKEIFNFMVKKYKRLNNEYPEIVKERRD